MKTYGLILLTLSTLLFSCGDDDGPRLIAFETLASGSQSPINPGRSEHVLNDYPEYEALFGEEAEVDFNTETVIAVFLGPLGGEAVAFEITEIRDEGSHLTVTITFRLPRLPAGPNTNYYHVIKTEKLFRDVRFSTFEIRE